MKPVRIAQILSEDIQFNNGILLELTAIPDKQTLTADWETNDAEYGRSKTIQISKDELLDVSAYPHIAKWIVLPDFMIEKDTNKQIVYDLIRNLFKNRDTLRIRVRQGAISAEIRPAFRVLPYAIVRDDNPAFYESWPNIVVTFETDEGSTSISTIIRLARSGIKHKIEPQEWIDKVERNFSLANAITNLPEIFKDYYGLVNDQADILMFTSGKHDAGLFLIPTQIELGGRIWDWKDGIERFTKNAFSHLKRQHKEKGREFIYNEIRMLFIKQMEETGQGKYLPKALLDPDKTIKQFADAVSMDEFIANYQV